MLNTIGAVLNTTKYCGSEGEDRGRSKLYSREYHANDGAGNGTAAPDKHQSGQREIPVLHGYPPASRGNAVLIPVRTN